MSSRDYEIIAPKPRALIESFRSVGYSMPTALADILDNSVTAQARNIWIEFHWAGQDSSISILDDGSGMDEATLTKAMRPGSANPLDSRAPEDLGRFGLGLKTASFSQCRRLSVWSVQGGSSPAGRCWDLDYVSRHDEWRLLKAAAPSSLPAYQHLTKLSNGTLVHWEQIDRTLDRSPASSAEAQARFHKLINDVRRHIAMIFHRYLEGRAVSRRGAIAIFVNGQDDENRIVPWNPFSISGAPSSKETPVDPTSVRGHRITVQGFVLPHKDRLSDEQYASAAGPSGWVGQQGFYIYRNDRIIVPGDWLRLGRDRTWAKEEHYKLARLAINIPNVMDEDWGLDIKKSTARPPSEIRERLTALADDVRKDARLVYSHRGDYGPRAKAAETVIERPWKASTRAGRNVYLINKEHPTVAQTIARLGPLAEHLKPLFRVLEETIPVERIWLDASESPDQHAAPYEGQEESTVLDDVRLACDFLEKSMPSVESLRAWLLATEPFRRFPKLIEQVLKERNNR